MKAQVITFITLASIVAIHAAPKTTSTQAANEKADANIELSLHLEPEELEALANVDEATLEEYTRSKRSGSGSPDFFSAIKHKISQSIKSKIAKLSSGSSSGSSGGYEHGNDFGYDEKFDWWELKKSILNTILQAVKAIKGGVIAVKGQLIKGTGKLISAKGAIIAGKGDQISKLGKSIAKSATLVPKHASRPQISVHTGYAGPSSTGAAYLPSSYGPPTSPYAVSGGGGGYLSATSPSSAYGSPSSLHHNPSQSYLPQKYNSAYEGQGHYYHGPPYASYVHIPKQINLNMHHTGTVTLIPDSHTHRPYTYGQSSGLTGPGSQSSGLNTNHYPTGSGSGHSSVSISPSVVKLEHHSIGTGSGYAANSYTPPPSGNPYGDLELHESMTHLRHKLPMYVSNYTYTGPKISKIPQSPIVDIKENAASGYTNRLPHSLPSQAHVKNVYSDDLEEDTEIFSKPDSSDISFDPRIVKDAELIKRLKDYIKESALESNQNAKTEKEKTISDLLIHAVENIDPESLSAIDDYKGPPPPTPHFKPLPLDHDDEMSYPMNSVAYQLYTSMGHKRETDDAKTDKKKKTKDVHLPTFSASKYYGRSLETKEPLESIKSLDPYDLLSAIRRKQKAQELYSAFEHLRSKKKKSS